MSLLSLFSRTPERLYEIEEKVQSLEQQIIDLKTFIAYTNPDNSQIAHDILAKIYNDMPSIICMPLNSADLDFTPLTDRMNTIEARFDKLPIEQADLKYFATEDYDFVVNKYQTKKRDQGLLVFTNLYEYYLLRTIHDSLTNDSWVTPGEIKETNTEDFAIHSTLFKIIFDLSYVLLIKPACFDCHKSITADKRDRLFTYIDALWITLNILENYPNRYNESTKQLKSFLNKLKEPLFWTFADAINYRYRSAEMKLHNRNQLFHSDIDYRIN